MGPTTFYRLVSAKPGLVCVLGEAGLLRLGLVAAPAHDRTRTSVSPFGSPVPHALPCREEQASIWRGCANP